MRILLIGLLAVGCTTSDRVTFGPVQVVANGNESVHVKACLDAEFVSCNAEQVELSVLHDGETMAMPYSGILFRPMHQAYVELGRHDEPFVISDGQRNVVLTLPTPFDLSGQPEGPLHPGDHLDLRWSAGGEPMVWTTSYQCEFGGTGGVVGDTIEDDGSLTISMDRIVSDIDRDLPCEIEIEVSRVFEGVVDEGFLADRGTAIERRSVSFTLE